MSAQTTQDVLSPQRKMAEAPYNDDISAMNEAGKVRTLLHKGKVKAVEMEEGLERYVQAKPIQSVLIAAGAGLLVGFLFGRRR